MNIEVQKIEDEQIEENEKFACSPLAYRPHIRIYNINTNIEKVHQEDDEKLKKIKSLPVPMGPISVQATQQKKAIAFEENENF